MTSPRVEEGAKHPSRNPHVQAGFETRPASPGAPQPAVRWTVVIPVKAPAGGKTRLAPALDDDVRVELARAFALDTIAAVQASASVERVIVVGDDPSLAAGAEFLAEPGGVERGLLPAIRHGIAFALAGSRDATSSLLDQRKDVP
ncbi:MAG TPA: hypothetical protein VFG92_06245, partial [Agromyces sp.]|nr:hypothetical protein [Agromyces sp.]